MDGPQTPSKPSTPLPPSSSSSSLSAPKPSPPTTPSQQFPIPSFPPTLNAYGQWGKIRSFNPCGATEDHRLCHVEVHTGYSGKPPLGTRPGVVLYNGKDSKAPVLAAACYDSEEMPALVRGGRVVFVFEVEVEVGGGEGVRRERFGWWKVGKGTEEEAKEGGFRLVALSTGGDVGADSAGQGGSSCYVPEGADGGEVLAFLTWRRLFPKFKHAFTLELLGRGRSGELGERWNLMVVITALRIWALRLNGRTKTGVIAAE
ncbi:hypothetical protein F5144DRAFT_628057 [Chaetomium tenue]|uniref:Uncharacterized protein n=1 Tax=Chaetomium tenue TaxID=1854479 RepID=A0ACB7PCD6_9PEZI|nr:hypothetical protein F5144DRAFT_628057 [Chaetomium globosum]